MHHKTNYPHFFFMIALHFMAMYALMYVMVNASVNVHLNLNQFYMAALMTASMVVIELLLMWNMYPNKRLNFAVLGIGVLSLLGSFVAVRQQTVVADEELLRSMIPHHAGALLMCSEAKLEDPQVQELCANITKGQQDEIDWMKGKLESLN